MKIGILTCENIPNLNKNDQPIISEIAKHNITAMPVIWSANTINWADFDYLIFRNTWDYFERETEFNIWLNHIEKLGIKTLNPLSVINHNKHKFYLQELEKNGCKIVPTIFINKTKDLNLQSIIPENWKKAVIKPAFSGAAFQTKVFNIDEIDAINQEYTSIAAEKELLLQEFIPEIQTLGETSLIFFNKKYSHAINKKPVNGDFRVQSQFGGQYSAIQPNELIIEQAQEIVNSFETDLLYARIDGIVIDNQIFLMELECIEPDLYFEYSENSVERFVEALLEIID